jgi:hypothetical protein
MSLSPELNKDPDFDQDKALDELTAEIDAIDFDGGVAPEGTEPTAPTPEPTDDDPEAEDEPTPDADDDDADDDPADDGEEEAESEPTQDEPEDGEADKPAIPDSHYRAAQRMGMTPEEVAGLYDVNPAHALKILSRCHEMVNASSKQLGELGRASQQVRNAPAEPQQPAADTRTDSLIAKLKDHYGDDDPMVEVVNELLKDRKQSVVQPQQQADQVPMRTVEEEIAARQQINTFFAAPDMASYEDFYGPQSSQVGDWSHLTPGQRANRVEVGERAQMILYGAAAAGVEMGTAEALERAHLEVAAPMAEQVVRDRIARSAKKRAKGITLKPGVSKPPARADGQHDEKQAIADVGQALKEVFGR